MVITAHWNDISGYDLPPHPRDNSQFLLSLSYSKFPYDLKYMRLPMQLLHRGHYFTKEEANKVIEFLQSKNIARTA